MSNRALKRLENNDNLKCEENEEEEDIPDDIVETKPRKNLFQMLSTEDGAGAGDEDSEDPEEGEEEKEDPKSTNNKLGLTELESEVLKKKKNKRKKKSKKTKAVTAETEGSLASGESDILDRILKDMELIDQTVQTPRIAREDMIKLLRVNPRNLNPENELKMTFGSRVVNEDKKDKQRKKRTTQTARSLLVSDPAAHRDALQGRRIGGITMEPDREKVNSFNFCYSPEYWKVQGQFKLFVLAMSHDDLIESLTKVGDHVDTLIQVSEIFRTYDDSSRASDLIERALFVLEKSFHSSFDFTTGACQLDFKNRINRPLFIALFLHIHYLSKKGCPRTALEMCKALLLLDPDFDPLAVLLIIDHLALRSSQYEYLIEFFETFQKAKRNLHTLPNFTYSVALAHFELGHKEQADKLLRFSLCNHPNVIKAIADNLSLMFDKKCDAVFGRHYPDNIYVKLYVERNAWLWKEPSVLRWVEQTCSSIIDSGTKIAPVTPLRRPLPINVLRHILLSNIQGVNASPDDMPPHLRQAAVYSVDPYPPTDSYGDLTKDLRLEMADDDILPDSTLANFINSLNPNWNGGYQGGTLRDSVNQLVTAVQDLLANVGQPPENNGAQPDNVAAPQPNPNNDNNGQ